MKQRPFARVTQRGSTLFAALLSCVACCSFTPDARAQETDRWLAPDKALHFGVSAGVSAASYAGATFVLDQPWQRAALAGGITLSLGAGKELYDATGHGDASLRDFAWDVIGCAVGVGLSFVIDLALRSGATTPRPGPQG